MEVAANVKHSQLQNTELITRKMLYNTGFCGLYCKNILMIVSEACTINVLLALVLALARVFSYNRK